MSIQIIHNKYYFSPSGESAFLPVFPQPPGLSSPSEPIPPASFPIFWAQKATTKSDDCFPFCNIRFQFLWLPGSVRFNHSLNSGNIFFMHTVTIPLYYFYTSGYLYPEAIILLFRIGMVIPNLLAARSGDVSPS